MFVHREPFGQQVGARARTVLGLDADGYVSLQQDSGSDVRRGCRIRVDAWIEDGQCNPDHVGFRWLEPWHEALFRFRYDGDDQVARGGVRVFAEGITLAEVNLTIPIGPPTQSVMLPVVLHVARELSLFASYSHKDSAVVNQLTASTRALGDDYIIDGEALRAGERWSERLDQLIREADAFQLFGRATRCDRPTSVTSGSSTFAGPRGFRAAGLLGRPAARGLHHCYPHLSSTRSTSRRSTFRGGG